MNIPLSNPAFARPRALTIQSTEASNPFQILGFFALQGFVFISCSRLSDLYLAKLHLPLFLSTFAILFTLLSGGLYRAISTTAGKLLSLFTLWMILIVPFSSWRGGSVTMLQDDWSRSFSCFLLVAGLTTSLSNCRRIIAVFSGGATLAAAIALIKNVRIEGRLSMPVGSFANSNDMAQALLFALPLSLFFIGKGLLPTIYAICSSGILLLAIIRTNSRSVMVALVVMLLMAFLRSSASQRVLIAGGALAGLMLMVVLLPKSSLQRYATIFGGSEKTTIAENEEDAAALQQKVMAIESSQSRKQVFLMSLELTLRNPIFGVGPGQFQTAAQKLSSERGERALWLETHNAYTQVSSETGIPGAILYLGLVITCFRAVIQLERATRKDRRFVETSQMARAMLFSLVGFAITSFFSSVAYKFMFPMVFGLALSVVRAGRQQLAAAAPATPAAPLTPPPASRRSPASPPAWSPLRPRPAR